MTLTVLKSSFTKQKPRVLNYCSYKFFTNTFFRDKVINKRRNSNLQLSDKDLKHFKETCLSVEINALLRKTKKAYYSNLNVKGIADNKKFWKTVKSFFSDKSNNFENISLIENGNLLIDDFEIAETFNKYFQNLVSNLYRKVPSKFLMPNTR